MLPFKKHKVEGLIKFYSLTEWWFGTFTEQEREYIDVKYQPMSSYTHSLTQGNISNSQTKVDFLSSLHSWFGSKADSSIAERIRKKVVEVSEKEPFSKPGYFKGRHSSSFVADVETLIRENKLEEAEILLFNLVDATEAESKAEGYGVAPWFYDKLALIYRKQKDLAKEVAILERFSKQKHAPGVKPPKLLERLDKAKALLKPKESSR